MSLLHQALQPDKIFDLPLALVKVQQAFQQANLNAERLKESLELVMSREQALISELNELKQEKGSLEESLIALKLSFKA